MLHAKRTAFAEVVLKPTGELDVTSGPALRHSLVEAIDAGVDRVVVDLAGVTFIDSTGLGVLVGAMKRARACDSELVLDHPSPSVRKVLQLTGIEHLIDLCPTAAPAPASAPAMREAM